jgi:uncharacterized membrane protein YoaK (UPF0700 family)
VTPAAKLTAGLLLTGSAGFVDAVGFLQLGGYFTSFMSGNTTQLGVGLARATVTAPALPLALVVMFFAGSLLGSLLALSFDSWGQTLIAAAVLVSVAAAIAIAALGLPAGEAMLPLAAGTGAQNAMLAPAGAARLGTTFVTGTLFAAAQDLARSLRRQAPAFRWLQHLAVWAALCAGAAIGAGADLRWGIPALVIPAAVYAGFLVDFARRAARLHAP